MKTTSVRLSSFGFDQAKTYLVAAIFIVGNIVLPQLCHLLPSGGKVLLPIYFFTLIGTCKYGWRTGLIVALFSPLVNSLLFSMPSAAVLPVILFKSLALALAGGLAVKYYHKASILLLAAAVLASQSLGGLFDWIYTGDFQVALHNFLMGIPGMLILVFGGSLFINRILRK